MPILKLEIFQNSKSQKCKLWGRPPPPFLEKVYILIFFFMMASLIGVLALCGCFPSEKEWKSPKMADVNKNRSRKKQTKSTSLSYVCDPLCGSPEKEDI